MKIFKKGEEFDNEAVDPGAVAAPAPPAAPADNDITDLVDWYLNPDAPSPVVNQQATEWTSPPAPAAAAPAAAPAPASSGTIEYTPVPTANPNDALQPPPAAAEPVQEAPTDGNLPVRFERPPLTEELNDLKREAKDALTIRLGSLLSDSTVSEEQLQEMVIEGLADVLLNQDTSAYSEAQLDQLGDELLHDILGHGPIEPLLEDPLVSEIMVNGPNQVFVERAGKIYETSARFESDAQVRRVIDRIVSRIGRRIDESSPMVDARLPDGSRVNAIIPPLAVDGPSHHHS